MQRNEIEVSERTDGKSVGKNLSRMDAVEIVTGEATYTTDITLPGMIHAKVLRSPIPHGRILSIDTSKAMQLEGVLAVITSKDVPRVIYNSADKSPSVPKSFPFDQYLLDDTVRYVGDQVAFVGATTEAIAERALQLIDVRYQELPAVFEPEEAMMVDSPKVNTNYVNDNVAATISQRFGDVEKSFSEADYIFEGDYLTPRQAQYPMEPHVSVARYDNGKLTVWSSLQTPFCVREQLAKVLQMSLGNVRIITPYVGGGFGAKQEMITEPIVSLLAIKTGRPVKLQFTSEEMFSASRPRHPTSIHLKTGVTKDGVMVAREGFALLNTGAYLSHGRSVTSALSWCFVLPYSCPNVKFDSICVYTNTVPSGAFRGFGDPQIQFAVESQIEEFSKKLGLDPLEVRLKNIRHMGDVDPVKKYVMSSFALGECLKEGAERIGWYQKRKEYASQTGSVRRGIGMACFGWGTSAKPALDAATAIVKMNEDGSANIITGIADMGMGIKTTYAIIAAEALGIRPSDIKFVDETIDTASVTFDKGTHASRSTYVGGNAVRLAALQVRKSLLEQASRILGVDVERLDAKDGLVFVRDGKEKRIAFSEIVADAQFGKTPHIISGQVTWDAPVNPVTSGAHFVEVEANIDDGSFRIMRIVAVNDVGRIINPMGARAQIEGAIVQGLGYALMEDLQVDRNTGKLVNPNLARYKMPLFSDVPPIEFVNIELKEPTGPFGAKGIGELGIIPIGPAIRNAILDATGAGINELPLTAGRLRKALSDAAAR